MRRLRTRKPRRAERADGAGELTPHDLTWLIDTSLPRVLGVFVPPLVFLSVQAVAGQQPEGSAA